MLFLIISSKFPVPGSKENSKNTLILYENEYSEILLFSENQQYNFFFFFSEIG